MSFSSVTPFIQLFGSLFGISFAVLILFSQRNQRANKYLSLLLLFTGLGIFLEYLINRQAYRIYPHLLKILFPANFLYGPLLYLFTCELTETGRTRFRNGKHFIPFAVVTGLLFPAYYLLPGTVKLAVFQGGGNPGLQRLFILLDASLWAHGIGYTAFSLAKARAYRKGVKEFFSGTDSISLTWLLRIVRIILAIWIVSVGSSLLSRFFPLPVSEISSLTSLTGVLLIYMIAYLMMGQPDLFRYKSLMEKKTLADNTVLPERGTGEKYGNIPLDDLDRERLYRRLLRLLEEEQLFLKQDLTVKELAGLLGVPSAHLSMVINGQSEHNFHSLINSFRVEEAKRLLISPDYRNRNILDIAYDAGFHSKSVFNRYFKKITGTTPLTYKKNVLNRPG